MYIVAGAACINQRCAGNTLTHTSAYKYTNTKNWIYVSMLGWIYRMLDGWLNKWKARLVHELMGWSTNVCKCKCCSFTATFVQKVSWMGRATSKCNQANWKIKHPSDRARPMFELRCYIYVANGATRWAMEAPWDECMYVFMYVHLFQIF